MGDNNLLESYNPLYDVHLRQYFASPHMQKHLRSLGLMDSNGVPVNQANNVEGQLYARHQVMMDMMLRNKERVLMQLADLQKKLDAAEKVEIYRRIRSGITNADEFRRHHLTTRSFSRPARSRSRPLEREPDRQRRHSGSYDDSELMKRIENDCNEAQKEYEHDSGKNLFGRLAANAYKYQYLHKLDDRTLLNYKDMLRRQLQKLERFREVSFGPHSVAKQPPAPQTSWFFRRRSLPSLAASAQPQPPPTAPPPAPPKPAARNSKSGARARTGKSHSPGRARLPAPIAQPAPRRTPTKPPAKKLPPLPAKHENGVKDSTPPKQKLPPTAVIRPSKKETEESQPETPEKLRSRSPAPAEVADSHTEPSDAESSRPATEASSVALDVDHRASVSPQPVPDVQPIELASAETPRHSADQEAAGQGAPDTFRVRADSDMSKDSMDEHHRLAQEQHAQPINGHAVETPLSVDQLRNTLQSASESFKQAEQAAHEFDEVPMDYGYGQTEQVADTHYGHAEDEFMREKRSVDPMAESIYQHEPEEEEAEAAPASYLNVHRSSFTESESEPNLKYQTESFAEQKSFVPEPDAYHQQLQSESVAQPTEHHDERYDASPLPEHKDEVHQVFEQEEQMHEQDEIGYDTAAQADSDISQVGHEAAVEHEQQLEEATHAPHTSESFSVSAPTVDGESLRDTDDDAREQHDASADLATPQQVEVDTYRSEASEASSVPQPEEQNDSYESMAVSHAPESHDGSEGSEYSVEDAVHVQQTVPLTAAQDFAEEQHHHFAEQLQHPEEPIPGEPHGVHADVEPAAPNPPQTPEAVEVQKVEPVVPSAPADYEVHHDENGLIESSADSDAHFDQTDARSDYSDVPKTTEQSDAYGEDVHVPVVAPGVHYDEEQDFHNTEPADVHDEPANVYHDEPVDVHHDEPADVYHDKQDNVIHDEPAEVHHDEPAEPTVPYTPVDLDSVLPTTPVNSDVIDEHHDAVVDNVDEEVIQVRRTSVLTTEELPSDSAHLPSQPSIEITPASEYGGSTDLLSQSCASASSAGHIVEGIEEEDHAEYDAHAEVEPVHSDVPEQHHEVAVPLNDEPVHEYYQDDYVDESPNGSVIERNVLEDDLEVDVAPNATASVKTDSNSESEVHSGRTDTIAGSEAGHEVSMASHLDTSPNPLLDEDQLSSARSEAESHGEAHYESEVHLGESGPEHYDEEDVHDGRSEQSYDERQHGFEERHEPQHHFAQEQDNFESQHVYAEGNNLNGTRTIEHYGYEGSQELDGVPKQDTVEYHGEQAPPTADVEYDGGRDAHDHQMEQAAHGERFVQEEPFMQEHVYTMDSDADQGLQMRTHDAGHFTMEAEHRNGVLSNGNGDGLLTKHEDGNGNFALVEDAEGQVTEKTGLLAKTRMAESGSESGSQESVIIRESPDVMQQVETGRADL